MALFANKTNISLYFAMSTLQKHKICCTFVLQLAIEVNGAVYKQKY